jgi:hypothetical protein
MRFWVTCLFSVVIASAYSKGVIYPDTAITQLRFLSEFVVPHNQNFKGTTIGGLSGIDYDPVSDVFYVLSDDRSSVNPARFYKVKIRVTPKGIDTVDFIDFAYFKRADGEYYPDARKDPSKTIDFEALRYDQRNNTLIVVSEGERIVKEGRIILADPLIAVMDDLGQNREEYTLPNLLKMDSRSIGPRQNGALEGLAFDSKSHTLFVALEEPLYQDGPPASLIPTKSWTRIFLFDTRSKKSIRQISYPLDPVAFPSVPADAYKINGVSEILWAGKNKLIVVERSFSTGRLGCTVRVFLADATRATDITNVTSLATDSNVLPMTKRLLLNMDDIGMYIDNIEGVTFGPILPNGHKTLIFVSDDNFAAYEKTQFLLFEVIP